MTMGFDRQPQRRIFLDLDGVMADFDRHFFDLFRVHSAGLIPPDLWGRIDSVPTFFRDLPICEGAAEFWDEIEHLNPVILTACPRTNYASVAAQKRAWVQEHLSPHAMVLPVMGRKMKRHFMQHPGEILIDDFESNVHDWREAGGLGILHQAFDRTAMDLMAAGIGILPSKAGARA